MKTPVKNQLFRFVTLRNPQLIAEEEKDPGFIFHPNESKSNFYKAVNGLENADKTAALTSASSAFSALKTRTEVRKVNEKLYRFASWLMRHKNTLSYVGIVENIAGVSLFSEEEELSIWENLIYQTINKTSVYVREACIQLLIANKFLKAFKVFKETVEEGHIFTDEQQREFTRRAHASVVISRVLFANTTEKTITKRSSSLEIFERNLESFVAEHTIEKYKILKAELKTVEATHKKEVINAHEKAVKNHRAAVQKIIDDTEPVLVEVKDTNGNIRQERTYPDLKLPEFRPVPDAVLDEKYLQGKISDDSLNILKEQKINSSTDFKEIYDVIAKKTEAAHQTIFKNKQAEKGKTISIGGVKMNLAKGTVNPYCFTAIHEKTPNGEYGMMMKLATDYPNASITDATFKIRYVQNGIEKVGLSVQNMASTTNSLIAFFKFDPFLFGEGIKIEFSGEFTLNNGKTYTFSVEATAYLKRKLVFNGCATLEGQVTDEPSTINTNRVYGVTKLGIADFRRVEQEVCCYVPGEVSHIENILAREYKERETRSLRSVESTTEQTRESEVENLNDTTTTERNEMQSEVSSVINEDESANYGVNAGVSGGGKNLKYHADSFADFSSSSAISDSNSQAQTYAQEVTERAMERIVQKVSTKRSTRILKEFEEKNIHGFDNTKGDAHVTGVYRWVDKIYKNKLINYGKRLMYEFAIPEPSRFFKEAIKKQVDDNQIDSNVILPDLPEPLSAYGIYHAGDLNEENYQYVAAQYGAEVNAAPEVYSYVGTSLTKSEQAKDGGSDTNKAPSDTIEVPKGYKAIAVKTSGKNKGIAQVTVGGLNLEVNSIVFVGIYPHYLEEVPVSAYFEWNWITNVNIVVKCERTKELFTQWQNETFAAIYSMYEEQLQKYNEAQQANEVVPTNSDTVGIRFNPLFNRNLEKREIKRIAIELLAEQKGHTISVDNYGSKNEETSIAKVNKGTALEVHASVVKFFEQAFDWDIMAYVFYPYFYADEKDWKALFQATDAADPLFQAFLQSGMARAVVPVRPGFEEAVNWYMETGELWNGQGLVVDMDDDLYISVSEEMQTIEGTVEGTWETRLPTALTIVQAESAALKEGGLPCYCEEENNPIQPQTEPDLIGGTDGPTVGGIGKFVVSS